MKPYIMAWMCSIFLIFGAACASAGPGEFGLAVKAGTLGAGLEATLGITEVVNIRIGGNYLSYDTDETQGNVEYEFDIELKSISLLFDWHPMGGGFRLSAGALYNGNEADATGKPTGGTFTLNNTTYTAAEAGTLKSSIDFDDFAPYIGIGYGNALSRDRRWNFVCDLGVMYQGSPNVSLTSSGGTLSTNAAFLSELENERQQLESEIEDYEFYPVILIGVSYKF